MAIGEPRITMAHGVLGFATPLPSQQDLDEPFMKAVQSEFPNLAHRQPPQPNTPPNVPRLVLTSTSSQLVLSAVQADFEVRFYGDYLVDLSLCLEYMHRKMETIRQGLGVIDQAPVLIGLITTLQFSFEETDERPAVHILNTHLRPDVDPAVLQDAHARVAVKLRDKYFLNLTVANYESRVLQRPIMPGAQPVQVKPWEGKVEDVGVELTVDINNNLEARTAKQDTEVTEQGIGAVVGLLERMAVGAGRGFVETGEIDVDQLVEEPA